jgi:hypothetical protein
MYFGKIHALAGWSVKRQRLIQKMSVKLPRETKGNNND